MHLIVQCSNCGMNVRPELGVATATTFQHRECADRFGIGTHGRPRALPIDNAVRRPPHGDEVHGPAAETLYSDVSG